MISHGLWNVTVEDLEDGQLPREVADWLDFDKAIGQCDEIHERMRSEYGMDDDGSSSNGRSRLVIFVCLLFEFIFRFRFNL